MNTNGDKPGTRAGKGTTVRGETQANDPSELANLLDQYLVDLQSGRSPDRARLLAEHPHLGPQLEEALAGLEFIHGAEPKPDRPPLQLGDFRIVREVGRGGMGVVYEAEQISLKRRVALKVLRCGATMDQVALQRFQREAETVARLHHTNIVPIFAVGVDQGVRYYAMEFIQGRDLAEMAQEARAAQLGITAEQAAGWGLQAAEALAHAHARGVIHRDIKPSNLILDADGRLWLTDFGLARRFDDVTLSITGALLGTPRYMSPEQAGAAARPVDHRTDIYSLGATLYELATQAPIFDAGSPHELIRRILEEEPVSPRRLVPTLPRDFETIILKCVAKEAGERYASAQALADDLRAFLEGRGIKARRPSVPEQALRWARKHRRSTTVAAFSAGAAVIFLVGGLGAWVALDEAQRGRLRLTTSEPLLKAEILAPDRDELVLPAFSVPTQQPVALPAGSYRVRLSAPERFGETLKVQVERGRREDHNVALADRALFAPFPIDMGQTVAIVDLDGASSFMVARMWEMRRLDGASGRELWRLDLKSDTRPNRWRNHHERVAWEQFFNGNGEEAQLLQQAPDLDGDGVRDLVWASANVPALLAVSGRTGEVLWWHAATPPPDATASPPNEEFLAYTGKALEAPKALDLDGDGRPDMVTLFVSRSRRWVTAVSGATGTVLWSRGLDAGWFKAPSWSNAEELLAPQIGRANGRPFVVVAAGKELLVLSAPTGEPLWSQDLPHLTIQDPRLADLDGDGDDDVVLLADRGYRRTSLSAFSIKDRRQLWERPLRAAFEPFIEFPEKIDWPLVADLNRDGRPEIVVPAWSAAESEGDVGRGTWTGLEVLDGRDGSLIWRHELARSRSSALAPQANRFLLGPDLDGDGSDDLVVASHFSRTTMGGESFIYVDALSGTDGHPLWWWSTPVENWNDLPSELAWWPVGSDGWPQLTLSTTLWPKKPGGVFVLAGGSGHLLQQIPNAFRPRVADCNGDGLPDLCLRTTDQPNLRYGAGMQSVVRGTSPTAWARLTQPWLPRIAFADLDGDGREELLQGNPLEIISGATGERLWRTTTEARTFQPLPLPGGDLDGDGVADILALQGVRSMNGSAFVRPVVALSGRTGQRLWTTDLKTQILGDVHAVECLGQDAKDGGRLALVIGMDQDRVTDPPVTTFPAPPSPPSMRLWLVELDRLNGSLLWKQPLSLPLPGDEGAWNLPVASADLDGDGVRDLIAGSLTATNGWELTAFRGTDGQVIWRHPLSARSEGSMNALFRTAPAPIAEDMDGDGIPEVLVVDYAPKKIPDPDGARFNCTLRTLDGRSGTTKWTYAWKEVLDQERVVPRVVHLRGPAKADICLLTGQAQREEAVLLDARGVEVDHLPTSMRAWPPTWSHADLDGDGAEEFLFVGSDAQLHVLRGGLRQTFWQQPADRLHSILPATRGTPQTVVIERGSELFGLAGSSGQVLWRCEGDSAQQGSATLLGGAGPRALPLAVVAGPGHPGLKRESIGALICRQALPTSPTGRYQRAIGAPGLSRMTTLDPRLARPTPWGYLARHDLTGTQRVMGVVFGGWLLGIPGQAPQRLGMVTALLPLVVAGVWGWKRRSWKLGAGVGLVVLAGATLSFLPGTFRIAWLSTAFRACTYALSALPPLIFVLACADALWGRRWNSLARLLGLAVLLAIGMGGVWLALDLPTKHSGEYYLWGDWYLVAVAGAGLAGVLVAASSLSRRARHAWKRLGRHATVPAPAPPVQRSR